MITLTQIKENVTDFTKLVTNLKTVEDARNLRHFGISESEIQVQTQKTDLDYINSELNENDEITEIRLDTYFALDYPTYTYGTKKADFDVFDEEIDKEYPFIEDATLDTIDALYSKAFLENIDKVDITDVLKSKEIYTVERYCSEFNPWTACNLESQEIKDMTISEFEETFGRNIWTYPISEYEYLNENYPETQKQIVIVKFNENSTNSETHRFVEILN